MIVKILNEISKGNFLLDSNTLEVYLPILERFLNGEKLNLEKNDIVYQTIGLHSKKITADTWVNKPEEFLQEIEEDIILQVPVNGLITKYDSCGWYGCQTYAQLLDLANDNPFVKGVVLIADSGGGSADGSFDFSQAVARFAKSKPIVTYVDGTACSAMYRIAAHSSKIIAKPGSILGSIGTMVQFLDNTEALKRIGLKRVVVTAKASSDKNKDYEEALKGNTVIIQEQLLDPMNDIFLSEMKALRQLPDEVLTGKIFYPDAALKHNMIDAIGQLSDAMDLISQMIEEKTFTQPSNQIEFNMKIPQSVLAFLGLASAPEQFSQEQMDQLGSLASLHSAEVLKNSTLQQEKDALVEQLSQKDESISQLNSQLSEKETTLQTLTQEREELKNQLADKDATIKSLTTEKQNLESKVAQYGAQPGAMPSSVIPEAPAAEADLSQLEPAAQEIVKSYTNS